MSETRRHALKILGTIGATCAFPFGSDELYGQHVLLVHGQTPAEGPYKPSFFTAPEFAVLSKLADVIIPETETPGAVRAGVPDYIDRVVSLNREHQPLARAGLAWLTSEAQRRFAREYASLDEAQHAGCCSRSAMPSIARYRSSSRRATAPFRAVASTTSRSPTPRRRHVPPSRSGTIPRDARMPVRFFRLIKNLTADGYYTSRVGLLEELGYIGNTYRANFPQCQVPEH